MKKKVYAYLHTHWDREWYRNKEDFNIRLLKVLDTVIDELKNNKAPFFYLDGQTVALLDYLKYRAEKKEEIKQLIQENKLAIGPYFASIDSYLVNFATMLKNLDLGLKISKEFNQKDFIGYMSDIFGISNSAFRALFYKKIDKALIWRGTNPEKINNICDFKFDEIKTTWLIQGYFNDLFNNENNIKNPENIELWLDKINKFSNKNLLLPIGADHLGILKDANKKIEKINSKLKKYEIILTSPFEYFKNTSYENKAQEKEFLDNSNTYILSGCWSSRIYQKTKNALLQNKLSRIIEPLNFYTGANYQKNIDFAYSTLIKCHAHDGICGCSLDSVHRAIDSRQEKVENILNSLELNLIGDFKKKYKIKDKSINSIGLFNLSNSENLNIVKIKAPYILENSQIISKKEAFPDEILYNEYQIPITEQITPIYEQLVEVKNSSKLSFQTLAIKKPTKKTKISEKTIENEFVKLSVKNQKIEIENKKTNEKVFLKLTDIKDDGDCYNSSPIGIEKNLELIKTKIIENGIIRSILRLYFKNNVELDVILDNKNEFLKFNSTINNKKKNHKIQIVFVLNENINKTIAQDAYGIIERNIDYNYKIQDFMPAKRPTELKTNTLPMQSFVSFKNNSILTKGLNSYEIYQNELKICLLRAVGTISNPKNKTRAIPAGPNLETLEAQCLFQTKQEFAFVFGNYKKAFNTLDIFFENYLALDGDFEKNINIEFDTINKNSYIYCINDKKKVVYDYSK